MNAADRIGLLPGFGWIVNIGTNWLTTQPLLLAVPCVFVLRLLTCWGLTPLGHRLVGLIGEGRVIPLDSKRQFESFYPGDLYLGLGTAVLLTTAILVLPAEHHWYNSRLCHFIILGVTLTAAIILTIIDIRGDLFPFWAMMSPSKWYHNLLLYGGYGYFAGSSFLAIGGWTVSSVFYRRWSWWSLVTIALVIVTLLCLRPWVKLVLHDSSLSKTDLPALQYKAQHAHVADWRFLGIIGPGTHWKFERPSLRR